MGRSARLSPCCKYTSFTSLYPSNTTILDPRILRLKILPYFSANCKIWFVVRTGALERTPWWPPWPPGPPSLISLEKSRLPVPTSWVNPPTYAPASASRGALQLWRLPLGALQLHRPHHCNLAPQLHHWTPRQTSSRHCPAGGRSSGPHTGGCVGIGGWR